MVTFAVSCLPAAEVAAAFWLGSVVVPGAAGSVVADVFAEASVVAAAALPCEVFGVTGVVAPNIGTCEAGTTCVCRVGVVAAAVTSAALVAPLSVVVVGVAAGSALPGTDGPGGGASGWELAAIAAAAIASGALGPPEVGVAGGGVLVEGADVEIATATGVGVVAVLAACCARMAASTAVESASVAESLDFVSVDGVESDEVVDDD